MAYALATVGPNDLHRCASGSRGGLLMANTCTHCSRVNPPEALYCYHDGRALAQAAGAGPQNVGAQAFPTPFVFPDGRPCRTFDELALTCQQNWPAARELLRQGLLENFLGGLDRADLAMA